ncbi:MAG: hypothetical protein HYR72_00285 [Deltaproteobacteria bacterium]|nr:hypothetical protein [Deltaproteobacteria bacterium]MBI3386103.1 hypothetical protein [Deltaproteobacteria bacterium]
MIYIDPTQQRVEVPVIGLLGAGFLSRDNLRVGWALTWRVGLGYALVCVVLRGALAATRVNADANTCDRLLVLISSTIANLLLTDWVARRIAYGMYGLAIDRFVAVAVLWRQAVATVAWLALAALFAGGGFAVVELCFSEAGREPMTAILLLVMLPVAMCLMLGASGWAAHRVFGRERGRPRQVPPVANLAMPPSTDSAVA